MFCEGKLIGAMSTFAREHKVSWGTQMFCERTQFFAWSNATLTRECKCFASEHKGNRILLLANAKVLQENKKVLRGNAKSLKYNYFSSHLIFHHIF